MEHVQELVKVFDDSEYEVGIFIRDLKDDFEYFRQFGNAESLAIAYAMKWVANKKWDGEKFVRWR